MNHIRIQELQDYQDGFSDSTESRTVELHLQTCNECRNRLAAIRQVGALLRRVPLEQAPDGFTEQVIQKLRIEPTPAYTWKLFEYLAPLLALAGIIGVVYALLRFTGAYENSEVQQSVQFTQSIYQSVGATVTGGLTAVNTWMEKYLSFAFAKNSYGLTTFLLVFFGAIALLDKFLLMPLLRKRT